MSYDITENKQQLPLCEKTIPLFNKEPQKLLNSHLIPPQTKAASPARPWIKAHASSSPTLPREGWHWSQSLLTEAIHGCSWSPFVPLDIKKPSTFPCLVQWFQDFFFSSYTLRLLLEGQQKDQWLETSPSFRWNEGIPWPSFVNSLQNEAINTLQPRVLLWSGEDTVAWHSFLKLLLLVFQRLKWIIYTKKRWLQCTHFYLTLGIHPNIPNCRKSQRSGGWQLTWSDDDHRKCWRWCGFCMSPRNFVRCAHQHSSNHHYAHHLKKQRPLKKMQLSKFTLFFCSKNSKFGVLSKCKPLYPARVYEGWVSSIYFIHISLYTHLFRHLEYPCTSCNMQSRITCC